MQFHTLKQGWTDQPLSDLKVLCSLDIKHSRISASFQVSEPSLRAENFGFNQKVWEDSCVELFLSFDGNNYYNFEINCIGSVLGQYGPDRHNRKFIDEKMLRLIKVKSSLGKVPFGAVSTPANYDIDIKIPAEIFVFDKDPDLKKARGNIYKCADRSPTPHYMYLYEITTEKPDFHRPEFFRELF
ncbi:MAG TPA: carbohydrate-binding family 9-like protein [bacterium]|nr:carbohydrate-binding family 9-like protein [bacterium]HPS30875.1 carbohydrate-binding family 9-like protein [bacterium]